jgi:hypothetical protein
LIPSFVESLNGQDISEDQLRIVYGSSRAQLDASLATLARFLVENQASPFLHRLNSDLFLCKSVQDAFSEQKKTAIRESNEILKLLSTLPLHSLMHQAFQLVHQAVASPREKLSLKLWTQVTDFVLKCLDSPKDSVRALATIQLQLSTLISALEAAEEAHGRVDEALQGINFGFLCLERVTAALAKQGGAPSVVGSLDANLNLLKVFLDPSEVGIRISGIALSFFENVSAPLRESGAVGFVPYVERLLEAFSSDSSVPESLLKRAAAVLLPFIPPAAASTLYAAAFSQNLEAEHWMWPLLMQSVEDGSRKTRASLPSHLQQLVAVELGALRFQPSYTICKRIFDLLVADSEPLKRAGIERVALASLVHSLQFKDFNQAFNPFDVVSQDVLSHIIRSRSISSELGSIGALCLEVQSFIYDIDAIGRTICESLGTKSLEDSFLPILLSYLKASRHLSSTQRVACLELASKQFTWLLDATSRSEVAADVLIELHPTNSISSEGIARHYQLWPATAGKSTRPALSFGALKLLANTTLHSNVDSKLLAIILKEIYVSGVLAAKRLDNASVVHFWLNLVRKDQNKLKALSASDVKSIVRSLLKDGLKDGVLLSLSCELLRGMKPTLRVETLKDLHDLLVSHPLFLDVLFGTAEQTKSDAAGELAQLMLYMYTTAGDSIEVNEKLLRVYLAAYSASLTRLDRAILRILHHFEHKGLSLARAGMCWGPHARKAMVTHAMQNRGADAMDVDVSDELEQQINTAQALFFDGKLIEAKRVSSTLRRFPARRRMNCSELKDDRDIDEYFDVPSASRAPLDSVYDPAFVIPFFALALRSFDMRDAKKFADIGGLSFTLMCLSCEDAELRQEAYNILALYDVALGPMQLAVDTFADFREQPQLRQLMNSIKYAITTPNERITSIVGSFLAQATFVAVRAEHPMCTPIEFSGSLLPFYTDRLLLILRRHEHQRVLELQRILGH